MGSKRTKEDDVLKISTSVFVTNFPEQASAKDLWNACKQYGHVVDAFIPNKRSKAEFIAMLLEDSIAKVLTSIPQPAYEKKDRDSTIGK
ncbi:nucleotide-binding alpha-beta plait domain-containing protein [Tanacetum coccineum]